MGWSELRTKTVEINEQVKNFEKNTKNMTEWWWYLSEILFETKSTSTKINFAPVVTRMDCFQTTTVNLLEVW